MLWCGPPSGCCSERWALAERTYFGDRTKRVSRYARKFGWGILELVDYRQKLAGWLVSAAEWLKRQPNQAPNASKFVDLAPTDEADEAGVYSLALGEATNNPRVMNIALTGPYGSGSGLQEIRVND